MPEAHGRVVLAAALLAVAGAAHAQPPPPSIDDFAALASRDGKVADAAAARLAPAWKNGYAALVIDLARFFRAARPPGGAGADPLDEGGGREDAFAAPTRTPESIVRARLMRFLARQTGQDFGDDLKRWRKWAWALPYDPHPDYAAFKARLYANVDPRMAAFFEAGTTPRIRLDEIDWGGVGVNGIPPLEQPKVIPAAAARYLRDDHVVFGLVVNGAARAYPKRILAWHELALDTLGGVRLAVVYCTLCGTVIPYESTVGGRTFTFGTSGLLYRSNKLMFDAETRSLWSTLEGRPVVGALAGSALVLTYRPVVTTTWKEWRGEHPDTTVLALETGHRRDYGEGVAYRDYFARDDLMFEVPEEDARLKRKAEVLTFFAGGDRRPVPVALDASLLRRNPVFHFAAGGAEYVAVTTPAGANRVYRADGARFVRRAAAGLVDDRGKTWALTEDRLVGAAGAVLPREPARRTFWFAWRAQFPGTLLFH